MSEVVSTPPSIDCDDPVVSNSTDDSTVVSNSMDNSAVVSNSTDVSAVSVTSLCDSDKTPDVKEGGDETVVPEILSKRELKKKRKEEIWAQGRLEKRKREREKIKARKRKAQENADGERGVRNSVVRKQLKEATMALSSCKQRICIDLSLDSYMSEKDLKKCLKQVLRCYSLNRRALNPTQFFLTSVEGRAKAILDRYEGSESWDVNYNTQPYGEVFKKEDIVYLTSESENVIRDLDESKVYVIGGLVDHNCHKGLCHKLAIEGGFGHARLPLDEYVDMKTRKVLTIDQVFDIMVRLCNKEPWDTSIITVLPQRKGAQLKTSIPSDGALASPVLH